MKIRSYYLLLLSVLFLGTHFVCAQNLQYTRFDATPLVVNPAFTGMTTGDFRANAVYRNQRVYGTPYRNYHASADAPVMTLNNGDYFGAGLLLNRGATGDGSIVDFTGMVSASYHKLLGKDSAWLKGHGCDLAIGVQAGYVQSNVYYSPIIFLNYSSFMAPSGGYPLPLYNTLRSYVINTGFSFSQSVTHQISYTVGFKAGNINQPLSRDPWITEQRRMAGLDLNYSVMFGGRVAASDIFSLRPAVIWTSRSGVDQALIGNEFYFDFSTERTAAVYFGVWYRTYYEVAMITAGANIRNFRIGLAYDYNVSPYSTANTSGLEITLGFVSPSSRINRRHVPCTRF